MHRVAEYARVGIQDSRYIFPDGNTAGIQQITHHGCRIVRTFAPERGRIAVRISTDKSLSDADAFAASGYRRSNSFLRIVHPHIGCPEITVGNQQLTHIEPGMVDTPLGKIGRNDPGRKNLSVRYQPVVPAVVVVAHIIDNHLLQFFQIATDRLSSVVGIVEQFADYPGVVLLHFPEFTQRSIVVALHKMRQYFFHGIGGFAHSRDDDEQFIFYFRNNRNDIADSFRRAHRSASEFVNFHWGT